MIAKGRNVASLFPAVVKNVVSKNPEVRTLGHAYSHVETKILFYADCSFSCVFVVCLDQETRLRLFGAICGGRAGLGLALN